MKKIFIKLCNFIPILSLIICINIYVDPANLLFSEKHMSKIASILIKGYNVEGLYDYDERMLQKEIIKRLEDPLDTIVLGSSRTMQISKKYFPNLKFFNNSVSGATIEDFIAIVQLYKSKKMLPSTIIIGIDPWLFNRNNDQTRWKSLRKEYIQGLNTISYDKRNSFIEKIEINYEKYIEFLSPSYFQYSVSMIVKNHEKNQYCVTSASVSDRPIKLSDGSINYSAEYRLTDLEVVKQKALSEVEEEIYSLENFDEIDSDLFYQFDLLIRYLKEEEVDIYFFLAPYHEMSYEYMIGNSNYKLVKEVQSFIHDYGDEKGLSVLGSYNPMDIPCQMGEFYDAMHAKPNCIQKILMSNGE